MRRRSTSATGGLQALVQDATARRAPPGLVAAVVAADGAVDLVTSGLADVRALRPVTAHTTFLWFSMTKIVTATASMMLADRGALDLDAPVIDHVPEMRVLHGPVPLITARHLLAHSSGLANPPAGPLGAASRRAAARWPGVSRPPAASAPAASVPPGSHGVLQQSRLPRPRRAHRFVRRAVVLRVRPAGTA